MKRDMELARQLLLQTEEKASCGNMFVEPDFTDVPKQVVSEHVKLPEEAGLIEARVNPRTATRLPARLTWDGHEFLSAAKNENLWTKAEGFIQEKGGAVTFDVAKTVLAQAALKQIGL